MANKPPQDGRTTEMDSETEGSDDGVYVPPCASQGTDAEKAKVTGESDDGSNDDKGLLSEASRKLSQQDGRITETTGDAEGSYDCVYVPHCAFQDTDAEKLKVTAPETDSSNGDKGLSEEASGKDGTTSNAKPAKDNNADDASKPAETDASDKGAPPRDAKSAWKVTLEQGVSSSLSMLVAAWANVRSACCTVEEAGRRRAWPVWARWVVSLVVLLAAAWSLWRCCCILLLPWWATGHLQAPAPVARLGGGGAATATAVQDWRGNVTARIQQCILDKRTDDAEVQSLLLGDGDRPGPATAGVDSLDQYLYNAIIQVVAFRSRFTNPAANLEPRKVGKGDVDDYFKSMLNTMGGTEITTSPDPSADLHKMNRYLYLTIVKVNALQVNLASVRQPEPGKIVDPHPQPEPGKIIVDPQPQPEPGKIVDPHQPQPEPGKIADPHQPQPEPGKIADPHQPQPEPGKIVDPHQPQPEPGKIIDPQPEPGKHVDPHPEREPGKPETYAKALEEIKKLRKELRDKVKIIETLTSDLNNCVSHCGGKGCCVPCL
ncbi:hypothetical protein ACP4OV_016512 [Aristida adscensionis]